MKELTTIFFESTGPDGFNQNRIEKNKDHIDKIKMMLVVVISLVVTFLPTLVLGVVLIVARTAGTFRSDGDEIVMLALTVVSFISLTAFSALLIFAYVKIVKVGKWKFNKTCIASLCRRSCCGERNVVNGRISFKRRKGRGFVHALYVGIMKYRGKGFLFCMVGGSAVIHSVEKVFNLILLLSGNDRLASDSLSQALIVFQVLELTSVASVLYILAIDLFFGDAHNESSSRVKETQRVEDSLSEIDA